LLFVVTARSGSWPTTKPARQLLNTWRQEANWNEIELSPLTG
jgi:hypothetical protein